MEQFLGEIRLVGFNFAPVGWALCDGQLLSIAANQALFAVLGTQFGGDGVTTFGLPDLRGRAAIGQGAGPGLTPRSMGELAGEENHALSAVEMPSHGHPVTVGAACSAEDAESGNPVGRVPAVASAAGTQVNGYATTATGAMAPSTGMALPSGGSQPHNTMQPFLVANYIIALEGIYPQRS